MYIELTRYSSVRPSRLGFNYLGILDGSQPVGWHFSVSRHYAELK